MNDLSAALISRRAFFRMAATLTGSVVVAGATGFSLANSFEHARRLPTLTIRLNPAFRIRSLSAGMIELSTHLPDGRVLAHHFSGFDAELLRGIEQGRGAAELCTELARLHNLSAQRCETSLLNSLRELETGRLVYYGEKMIVKRAETTGGH